MRVADRIITDATFTVGEIERVFPAAAGRITAIPLGVDDFASGPVGPLPEPLRSLAEKPYLLSMGSTRGHKDLPTLLSAFAAIAPARPELRLLLVGAEEPGYLERVLADAAPAVRERVAFTGRVDDGALRALMAGAAVFAFPSRYEGFGLPPLEAMALGTPAVVADAASLPEVVGEGALTFAAGDSRALASAHRVAARRRRPARARERGRAGAGERAHVGAYGGGHGGRVPAGSRPPELGPPASVAGAAGSRLRASAGECALRYPV